MADIEELVEQFKADATRTGAVVYEAEGAGDARDYVLKLAQEHGVRHIVKSKSAVAEAIGLREHLEEAGIEVRETDIGQWIAQLAGEKAEPVIDKTIEQVAGLISAETGQKLGPEPEAVMGAARRYLRQSYINADMGITGADFGIAETGTMVNLSNDGNDRLASVLPPVHVTMMKRENIVATLSDAIHRIKSLTGESVGGQIPSYITYHTGRNTTGDIRGALMARAQGPEEEHIVLLGNS